MRSAPHFHTFAITNSIKVPDFLRRMHKGFTSPPPKTRTGLEASFLSEYLPISRACVFIRNIVLFT